MLRRYVTTDVFTDRLFGGNPLAVVLDAVGLTDTQMQSIAREFNYSETTFVLPPRDAAHSAQVRIYTPRVEVPFAGHPNVGTAFVLANERQRQGLPDAGSFVFEERAGLVPITLLREQAAGAAGGGASGAVIGAELRAPEALSRRGVVAPESAAACLSLPVSAIATNRHAPQVVSVGLPFLVVELNSRDALRSARAHVAAHEALLPLDGADCVFTYVREASAAADGSVVLHARMFAPLDGVPEDPATGSATAATIALLAALEGSARGEQHWRIHQGVDMGRPSLLLGRTVPGREGATAVYVGGHCVAVFAGSLEI
jgi:trans-2,3-dihydro-3-hydroxyanthranilate isomerase